VAEAFFQGDLLVFGERVRRDELDDRQVFRRRPQILAEGEHGDVVGAEVVHRAQDLLARSPRPSMMPLLVATLPFTIALAFFSTVRLRWYWARERTSGVRRSTVSMLWLKMCGRASITSLQRPVAVVEIRHEHLDDDFRIRLAHGLDGLLEMLGPAIAEVVAGDGGDDHVAQAHAAGGLGDAGGSSASSASGLAVFTAQKPQARVHFSPAIMKVAVRWLQHSQRFGHWASSQTVTSFRSVISDLVDQNSGLFGSRTLIQDGFWVRCKAGSIFIFGPQQLMPRN
jgi:hypothetical protein